MITKFAVFIFSTTFWIIMTLWLITSEIVPFFGYKSVPSYKTFLEGKSKGEELLVGIYVGGKRLGSITTRTEPLAKKGYKINNLVEIKIWDILGQAPNFEHPDSRGKGWVSEVIRLSGNYFINEDSSLTSFDFNMMNMISAYGTRGKDGKLYINFSTPLGKSNEVIDLPADSILSDSFLPFYGDKNLMVGKKWKTEVLDVDILGGRLKFSPAYFIVEAIEERFWKNEILKVFRVEMRKMPQASSPLYTMWITKEGTFIEAEFTFGKSSVRLVREDVKPIK